MSDSIHINTEQIETSVYLFYNDLMQEFYAVIRENTDKENAAVKIYSLLSPPVNRIELKAKNTFHWYWLLFLIPFMLILAILVLRFKSREKIIQAPQFVEPEKLKEEAVKEIEMKNSVLVFGDFMVFDKTGKDISYRFSSKLRSLFSLILFYSIDTEGISTDKLTSELWPDKDVYGAKNTRGVTINRLRNILADISGITLFHINSKWYFELDSAFYCDYVEYRNIINSIENREKTNEDENMRKLLGILKRGALLPGVQEKWVDTYKHAYENEVEKILWKYILKMNENKKYAGVIEFSDLFFMIDPLNEEMLKLTVNAFQKIGKRDQAILLHAKFVSNYKKMLGQEPDLPQLL